MNTALLIMQILSYLPPVQISSSDKFQSNAPHGTGSIIVADCQPGETVAILPGPQIAIADGYGVARSSAPAETLLKIVTARGGVDLHGTVKSGEIISGVCP